MPDFLQQSDAVLAHDVEAHLGRILAPTHITVGTRDQLTSTRFADRLKRGIRNSELLVFDGCAHAALYERVEEFNQRTLAFLRRHAGAAVAKSGWSVSNCAHFRSTVSLTDGFIEVRKNVDIAGRPGESHLFLVDQKETRYIDCSKVPLPYGEQLVNDVLNRTETAMTQAHCYLATELVLKAQQQAQRLTLKLKGGQELRHEDDLDT